MIGEGGKGEKSVPKKAAKKIANKVLPKKVVQKCPKKSFQRESWRGWKGEPTVRSRWLQF